MYILDLFFFLYVREDEKIIYPSELFFLLYVSLNFPYVSSETKISLLFDGFFSAIFPYKNPYVA